MALDIRIRKPESINDFNSLYRLGLSTPEFKVSSSEEFMDPEEFFSAIENPTGIFLLAEEANQIIGFIYANRKDMERGPATKWACLVYMVVKPEYRSHGVARQLYDECIRGLKRSGVTHLYGWANSESDGAIINFLEKQGFSKGHKYVWMDKAI